MRSPQPGRPLTVLACAQGQKQECCLFTTTRNSRVPIYIYIYIYISERGAAYFDPWVRWQRGSAGEKICLSVCVSVCLFPSGSPATRPGDPPWRPTLTTHPDDPPWRPTLATHPGDPPLATLPPATHPGDASSLLSPSGGR
jgi:hypothetical protein